MHNGIMHVKNQPTASKSKARSVKYCFTETEVAQTFSPAVPVMRTRKCGTQDFRSSNSSIIEQPPVLHKDAPHPPRPSPWGYHTARAELQYRTVTNILIAIMMVTHVVIRPMNLPQLWVNAQNRMYPRRNRGYATVHMLCCL
jgi:hypothetical protein